MFGFFIFNSAFERPNIINCYYQ